MNIFETHPNLEKCFSTSDGEHFYNENDAKNHAKSLEDNTVEPVYNAAFLADATISNLSEEDLEAKAFEESEKMAKELKDTELVKRNYQKMKSLVKYFEIEVANQSADTLIKALEEYKSKIKE
jgi:ABC-type uncharacterized transport system auxiliary subunit